MYRLMVVSKETIKFIENPKVKPWAISLPSDRLKEWYPYNLIRFLTGINRTPEQFLTDIETDRKQTSITTKTFLGSLESKAVARVMLSAVKSFTSFYESDLPLNGLKIRVKRVRKKPYLSWDDTEKIIVEAKEPYRSIYRFLLWGGIGLDEFSEIQESTEIQTSIELQRNNEKPYIRIDLEPRKSNLDTYFTLIPKQYVPKFPFRTADYGNRGGQMIEAVDIQLNWQRARKRAGIDQVGLGPHTLRSVFSSECAKAGVAEAVAEYQMGHGAGDTYGYRREVLDESYAATELSKLWTSTTPATTTELEELRKRVADLENKTPTVVGHDAGRAMSAVSFNAEKRIQELIARIETLERERKG